jgi:Fe-S cluster assembly protein SufD
MTTVTHKKDLKSEIVDRFQVTSFDVAVAHRNKAISNFEKLGLPSTKTEEYRFTPITKALEKNFSWKENNSPSSIERITPFLIPEVEATLIVFINGVYSSALSGTASPEVKITTLSEALQTQTSLVDRYFDKLVNSALDPFAAMNTSFWKEGLFIHVPENTIVKKPILILHIADANASQVIVHTRVLAIVEKNSKLTLIEKFDSVGEHPVFHTTSEEIELKANAQLEYCKIQCDSGNTHQVANTAIQQSDSSKVNTFTLTMNGKIVRNNLGIIIDGEHCESHFHGLYLLNGNSLADNHTVVDHRKPNSFSNEIYKGVMDANSKGVFNGKIFVRPHAQKTNAFQSNRNILVSDTATINTKPQLEIWADDVKCSHGCTSGQLDEEALFYLQSRGISEKSAQAMLLYAFATDVLEPIKNEKLKQYMDQKIAERLNRSI